MSPVTSEDVLYFIVTNLFLSLVFGFCVAWAGRMITIIRWSRLEQADLVSWREWIAGCAVLATVMALHRSMFIGFGEHTLFIISVAITHFVGITFGGIWVIRRPIKIGKRLDAIKKFFEKRKW
ncbi:hypothetical protein HY967_01730 [Candidatus Jorgensenbacteria bacterium]|nr:hypothetical protein [Candidatus Jorgensenbacteria bacterium]